MARRDVPKASDLHAGQRFSSFNPQQFKDAFPQIAELSVEVTTDFKHAGESDEKWTFDLERTPNHYINCIHWNCHRGAFSLIEYIQLLVDARRTSLVEDVRCHGYEGTPSGKRQRSCIHSYHLKITIAYRDE